MKFITNNNLLSCILVAYLFLFAISDVRGDEEGNPSGDISGDGSGDGSGIDPEGSGNPCDGFECANETDVCKVKQLCVGDKCEDVPMCEGTQDQIFRRCRKRNEVYRFCGTRCEPTCDNQDPRCRRGCKWFTCQCRRGYVRDSKGDCVRPERCPKKCGRNAELKRCGTSCEATCKNQNPSFCRPCKRNVCQCKDGYVRDSKGDCVRTRRCPKDCERNEELKRCGTSCEATCRDQNPSFCRPCKRNVCQCKDGYVRSRRGNCIPKSWCRRG